MSKESFLPEFCCESCGGDIFDTDHLEWTDRILCPTCYDNYVFNENIEIDEQ